MDRAKIVILSIMVAMVIMGGIKACNYITNSPLAKAIVEKKTMLNNTFDVK